MLDPHVFITLEAPSDPFAAGLPMGPLFPIAEKARFQRFSPGGSQKNSAIPN